MFSTENVTNGENLNHPEYSVTEYKINFQIMNFHGIKTQDADAAICFDTILWYQQFNTLEYQDKGYVH